MVKEEFGLKRPKLEAKPILGFTSSEIAMADMDNMTFKSVQYWSDKAMKKFRRGGYIILKSSLKHYHTIFDRKASFVENMKVVAWIAILSKNVSMLRYLAMQLIKGSLTLRVGRKGDKGSPRVVFRYGEQGHAVAEFLRERQRIKRISRLIV